MKALLLLLELGTVPLSGDKRLPYPGLPGNCRLLSWDSRKMNVVSAELGELSQTSGYSFLLGLYRSWQLSRYWKQVYLCSSSATKQEGEADHCRVVPGSKAQTPCKHTSSSHVLDLMLQNLCPSRAQLHVIIKIPFLFSFFFSPPSKSCIFFSLGYLCRVWVTEKKAPGRVPCVYV